MTTTKQDELLQDLIRSRFDEPIYTSYKADEEAARLIELSFDLGFNEFGKELVHDFEVSMRNKGKITNWARYLPQEEEPDYEGIEIDRKVKAYFESF